MVEAIVGVALRAILASFVLGGGLAALVLFATRTLGLTAATRHALWTTALIATAVMPLAGVAVSVSRAYAPGETVTASTLAVHLPIARQHEIAVPNRGNRSIAAWHPAAATIEAPRGVPLNLDFRPRVSRAIAVGLVGIWLAGALAGMIGLAASIIRVRGLKRRSSPLDGALSDELPWLTAVDAGREIYLRLSFEIETPVAIGFRRPVILIPTELATADGLAAIEPLVLHEYAHLRRYDDWSNLVQRSIERVLWFNPIVWLVGRKIALEREIASDDAVVDKTGAPHAYATSLWKLAREMRMPEHAVVAPGALLTRKQITIRIEQLLDKKRARLHRSPAAAIGVGLAGVLAVALVATSAPAVELPTAAPVSAHVWAAPPPVIVWHANPAPALTAVPNAAPKRSSAGPAQAPREVRIIRIVQTPNAPTTAAKQKRVIALTAAPAEPMVPSVPPLPAVTPLPPVPSLAPVAPIPSLSLEALRKIRAASAAAAATAHAHRMPETATIANDIARAFHEAMDAIPSEIGQGSATLPHLGRRLDGIKLTRAQIASCVGCSFRNTDAHGLDLHGLRLNADDFRGADMRGVNLAGAQLNGVSLAHANLANADLRGVQISGVDLTGANLDGALLDGIKLTGVSIRHISLQGTSLRSLITNCTGCDLSHLDLRGQDLHGIWLTGADLSYADLRDANLSGARFSGVDLTHAKLAGADLTNAHFEGCDISSADLRNARTSGMTMTGTEVDG